MKTVHLLPALLLSVATQIAWSGDSQALRSAPDVLHRYVGVRQS